jgi:hypothetical protein
MPMASGTTGPAQSQPQTSQMTTTMCHSRMWGRDDDCWELLRMGESRLKALGVNAVDSEIILARLQLLDRQVERPLLPSSRTSPNNKFDHANSDFDPSRLKIHCANAGCGLRFDNVHDLAKHSKTHGSDELCARNLSEKSHHVEEARVPSPEPSQADAGSAMRVDAVTHSMIESPTLFVGFLAGSAAGALVAYIALRQRQAQNGEANERQHPLAVEDIIACAGLALLSIVIAKAAVASQLTLRAAASAAAMWLLDMTEAAMYASIYAILAAWFGAIPDAIFPVYDSGVAWPRLLVEVGLQAGFNVVFAQAIRDCVKQLPLPDLGAPGDRTGTATGGGIILSTLLFSRQAGWKAKVALLDKLLGLHVAHGIPRPILELILG